MHFPCFVLLLVHLQHTTFAHNDLYCIPVSIAPGELHWPNKFSTESPRQDSEIGFRDGSHFATASPSGIQRDNIWALEICTEHITASPYCSNCTGIVRVRRLQVFRRYELWRTLSYDSSHCMAEFNFSCAIFGRCQESDVVVLQTTVF